MVDSLASDISVGGPKERMNSLPFVCIMFDQSPLRKIVAS